MKGDFSRFPGGDAGYGGVWMQQGRVQLDADWNEQVALSAWRDRMVARDAMGGSGAPADDPGFRVSLRSGVLLEAPGHGLFIDPDPAGPLGDPAAPFTIEILVTLRPGGRGGPLLHAPGICTVGVGADGTLWMSMGGGRLAAPRALRFRAATWVAVTWDGAAAALHVDGALRAAGTLRPGGGARGALSVGAGPDGEGGTASLDGLLGEARLWGAALSAGRLRDLAAGGPAEGEPRLAGWWRLDEGAGETARDAARGRHGRVGAGARAPRWLPPALHAGPGRYWVDGTLCANPGDLSVAAQPDLPGVRPPAAGDYLVYLDVWERWLSPVEDPAVVEVALDGADTTGRTRTVWQVRTLPVRGLPGGEVDPGHAPDGRPWAHLLPPARGEGRMAARGTGQPADDNRLYRVEIHRPGGAWGVPRPAGDVGLEVVEVDAAAGRVRVRGWAVDGAGWQAGQTVEVWSRATEARGVPGVQARVTHADARAHTLELHPFPPGLSVDDGVFVRPLATWVWSRDNGSIVYGIAALDPASGQAALRAPGRPGQTPLAGEWMEALDDVHTLQGRPGPLCRVTEAAPGTQTATLKPSPGVSPDPARHPLLRRWEAAMHGDSPETVVQTGWTAVDTVVQVCFEPAAYRTGDFWTIPVRELGPGPVQWPAEHGTAAALRPQGIVHGRAPLALVRHGPGGAHVTDLRRIFAPVNDDAVRRHGPQHMHGPLSVAGDVVTRGTLRGTLAECAVGTPALADFAVTTDKLADGSVTAEKLAVPVGGLPAGACVLGERAEAPPGFRGLGAVLDVAVGDPAWTSRGAAPLADPVGALAAVLHGVLYAVSGDGGDLWAWDAAGGWENRAAPRVARRGAALCAHGGRLLLVGGWAGDKPVDAVEAYDPAADAWTSCAPLPTARGWAGAASAGARMHVFGGGFTSDLYASANEAYDDAADRWTACCDMLMDRFGPGAAALNRRLYAVGGVRRVLNSGQLTAMAEVYDPDADRWQRVRSLLQQRANMGITALDGALYVAGGRTAGQQATVTAERYDAASDRWSAWTPLPAPGCALALAALDGAVFRVGGRTDAGQPVGAFEELRFSRRLYAWCRE